MKKAISVLWSSIIILLIFSLTAIAATYEVGPGKTYQAIGQVPWTSLKPGDKVLIYYKDTPYHEKWAIDRAGTSENPIVIQGVPGPEGQLPVIDGKDAVTGKGLNFWSEERGIINIGGSNVGDQWPQYIVIENLDIRNARPPYNFSDDHGSIRTYSSNAAAIYIIEGDNITVRNCIIHQCGNGIFASHAAGSVLIEYCHIFDNGIEGSYYQHNVYTETRSIVYQFNHFGPLRAGCGGNNLKDRSAGTVIRYNWIEGGNRQLDLVDAGHEEIINLPSYRKTYVYGNILVERSDEGNSQIVHYGGDSGDKTRYRKGTLYFYNNTVVSKRTGNTTIFRLSSQDETCIAANNIFYVTGPGHLLALSNRDGTLKIKNNWLKTGWVKSHEGSGFSGSVLDLGGNLSGSEPGFNDFASMDLGLSLSSPCVDRGSNEIPGMDLDHPVLFQYVKHQKGVKRPKDAIIDIGAYEALKSGVNSDPEILFFRAEPSVVANPMVDIHFSAEASDPDGDSLSYVINFGDGSSSPGRDLVHKYRKKGIYRATLTVRDSKGGSKEASLSVTVNDAVPAAPKNPSLKK